MVLIRLWGKEKFDRVFLGKEEFTLPLRISHYAVHNPIYRFIKGEQVSDISKIRIGDKMGIRNHPVYSGKHPIGAAPTWNFVVAELMPEIKVVGFGFDGKRLIELGLKMLMIDNYNIPPIETVIPELKADVPTLRGLFKHSFSDKIDRDVFDESSAGYNLELIRLSAKRARMLLDMPLDRLIF